MNLTPVASFITLFWHNLCCYQHNALGFELGYNARGINISEKSFVKLTPVANFMKLFCVIIYAAIGILR